jgi:hypothetical protein
MPIGGNVGCRSRDSTAGRIAVSVALDLVVHTSIKGLAFAQETWNPVGKRACPGQSSGIGRVLYLAALGEGVAAVDHYGEDGDNRHGSQGNQNERLTRFVI